MTSRSSLWFILALLALLTGGLTLVFQLRVGTGDLYPIASSMRADPLGTRLFHDSLAALPDMRVERNLEQLPHLRTGQSRTIIMAGVRASRFLSMEPESISALNALDACVRSGDRLVVAFASESHLGVPRRVDPDTSFTKERAAPLEHKSQGGSLGQDVVRPQSGSLVTRLWGVELWLRKIVDRDKGALRVEGAGEGLPADLEWKTCLYFKPTAGAPWRVLMTHGSLPCVMELQYGRGSIVLASDTYFLSNEALAEKPSTDFLSWIVGSNRRVLFEENHLGLAENVGVAALASRYGLGPAIALLLIVALLYIWRSMALFVPPEPEAGQLALEFHPTAGLEALLRRSLPSAEAFQGCVTEWKKTAHATDIARLASLPPLRGAVAYNAAVKALRRHAHPTNSKN